MGKIFEQTFRRYRDGKAHMKRYSISLIIMEMKVKATVEYHFPNAKMAEIVWRLITLSNNDDVEKLELSNISGREGTFLEKSLAISYSVKCRFSKDWPSKPLLGTYPRKLKTCLHRLVLECS